MSTMERAERANARGTVLCWVAVPPLLASLALIGMGLNDVAPLALAPGILGFILGIGHMAWADGYEAGRKAGNRAP